MWLLKTGDPLIEVTIRRFDCICTCLNEITTEKVFTMHLLIFCKDYCISVVIKKRVFPSKTISKL